MVVGNVVPTQVYVSNRLGKGQPASKLGQPDSQLPAQRSCVCVRSYCVAVIVGIVILPATGNSTCVITCR